MMLGRDPLGLTPLGTAEGGGTTPVAARHVVLWTAALTVRHIATFGAMSVVSARHVVLSGSRGGMAARHVVAFGAVVPVAARHAVAWARYHDVAARHAATWAVLNHNPVAARREVAWALQDAAVQISDEPTYLEAGLMRLALGEGTVLSADEGSPYWLATLELIEAEDYARVQIGDALTLTFWGEPIALLCDGRRKTLSGEGAPRYWLSARSPVAALGPNWAVPQPLGETGLARAVIERLLDQAVTWQLPDWQLPASAADLEAVPLELARQIVGAAGGLLESRRDGTLRARPAYPVSVPNYAQAPAAVLTARDLLAHEDRAQAADLVNRLTITSSTEIDGDAVQIEAEQDEDDPHAHTVRAYPVPWRPVTLVHTGDGATTIGPRNEITRELEELVEIRAGAGSVPYPVDAVLSADYQHADLGAVHAEARALTTQSPEYSQVALTYRTRAWQWRVTNARTETIQFLAME